MHHHHHQVPYVQATPPVPPPAVVRIDHQGDLKVDNMQTAGVSLHQGLSPSLWGSPAASRIPATTSSAPLTLSATTRGGSATAFMEGSVMEKKKDKMGLFNWVPRYMAISKPPSGGEGGHTGETPNILLWNLPPGTAAPGKPTDKQPDETISCPEEVVGVEPFQGKHKARFEVLVNENKQNIISTRSFMADSPAECVAWIAAFQAVSEYIDVVLDGELRVNGGEQGTQSPLPTDRIVQKIMSGTKKHPPASSQYTQDWAVNQIVEAVMNKRSLYGAVMAGLPAFFKAIDRNGDGVVTKDEFCEALKRLDLGLDGTQLNRVCVAMGCERPRQFGKIRYVDFLRTLRDVLQKTHAGKPRKREARPKPRAKATKRQGGAKKGAPKPAPEMSSRAKALELKKVTRQARIVARSIAQKKKVAEKKKAVKRTKRVTVRVPVATSTAAGARPAASVKPSARPSTVANAKALKPVLSTKESRAKRPHGGRQAAGGTAARRPAKKALSKSFQAPSSKAAKGGGAGGSIALFAFQEDIKRLKAELRTAKNAVAEGAGRVDTLKATLDRERKEFAAEMDQSYRAQKERDTYNAKNLDKLHSLYGGQIDKLKAVIDDQAHQLAGAREDVVQLTVALHGQDETGKRAKHRTAAVQNILSETKIVGNTVTTESVWIESMSRIEAQKVEAVDNERMMKKELVAANEALTNAIASNKYFAEKTNRSEKLVKELRQALKLSKEESKLLENERKRLTLENTELSNAIEKMDSIVYGHAHQAANKPRDDRVQMLERIEQQENVAALRLVQSMTNMVDDTLKRRGKPSKSRTNKSFSAYLGRGTTVRKKRKGGTKSKGSVGGTGRGGRVKRPMRA